MAALQGFLGEAWFFLDAAGLRAGSLWKPWLFLGAAGLRAGWVCKPGQPCILCISVPSLKWRAADLGKIQRAWQRGSKDVLRAAPAQAVTQRAALPWSRSGDSGDGAEICRAELHREGGWGAALTASSTATSRFRWEAQSKQKALALGIVQLWIPLKDSGSCMIM